ncbi:MAG: hypothetical protein HZA22_10870 [Nitrospirae bacterium]|nr:hypothetical protein [Nitrospirota bacterium]MBI5696146.1 hypothetical protein [Nitrospirota bacterium]
MRWRFTDRVESFESWKAVRCRKTVSLEEYSLLKPFGLKGAFPVSLVMECCVSAARWLASASTRFEKTCLLDGVSEMTFAASPGKPGIGDALIIEVRPVEVSKGSFIAECSVAAISGAQVAAGTLSFTLADLHDMEDASGRETLWREIYAGA